MLKGPYIIDATASPCSNERAIKIHKEELKN
jgi:hypothetical protein